VSKPEDEEKDFHFDLVASGPQKSYARPTGIVIAAVTIVFIIATMTTNVATSILPMNDEYLNALIPLAPDGAEPLSLQKLEHETAGKTVTVRGVIGNRTEYPLKDMLAVIQIQDAQGIFQDPLEIPVDPPEIPVEGTAAFQGSATLSEQLGGYIVKFRIADGPLVPHKDDRASFFILPAK
jgi:hypothetical protein